MNHRDGSIISSSGENFALSESVTVHESSSSTKIDTITFESLLNKEKNESISFNIELNMSGIVDSAVQEATRSNNIRHTTSSLKESFISELGSKLNEDSKAPKAKGTLNSLNDCVNTDPFTASARRFTSSNLDPNLFKSVFGLLARLKLVLLFQICLK